MAGVFRSQFCLGAVWSTRRPVYAVLRYQLIARATYLPEDYLRLRLRCQLIAKATYLRCATVRQASVSVGRVKRPVFAALRLAHSAVREKTELRGASGGAIISL